ncbi:MAG: hypothetical protein QW597_02025 [Thermoplasmataceae archaeon]
MEADRVTWKISIIGPLGVGKSSLISRIVYDSDLSIGNRKQVARKKLSLDYDGHRVNADLLFIETEEGSEMEKLVSGSNAIIAAVDITDRKTLPQVETILRELNGASSGALKVVVGTKLDRKYEAVLWEDDLQRLGDKYSTKFFLVSAKDPVSVKGMMSYILNELLQRFYSKRKKNA